MQIFGTRTYSPKEVLVVVGVVPVLTFNSVAIQYSRPRWSFYEGTQGELTRGKVNSALGSISIEIPRTSLFNDGLSGMYALGGVIPVAIKDLLGISIHVMSKGTIINMPSTSYEKNVKDNRWIISGKLSLNVNGGSNDVIGSVTGNIL